MNKHKHCLNNKNNHLSICKSSVIPSVKYQQIYQRQFTYQLGTSLTLKTINLHNVPALMEWLISIQLKILTLKIIIMH